MAHGHKCAHHGPRARLEHDHLSRLCCYEGRSLDVVCHAYFDVPVQLFGDLRLGKENLHELRVACSHHLRCNRSHLVTGRLFPGLDH